MVEDEAAIREILVRALRREGYETEAASDGDEALEKAFALLPDLIVLDIMLPRMDGWEVCRRLKGDSKTASIFVLMLSARLPSGASCEGQGPFAEGESSIRSRGLRKGKPPYRTG